MSKGKKMAARRPIGIFDSGIGGLTVMREVCNVLPDEEIVYFGDTARVPYGTKSKETVTRFSKENIKFLLRFNVKLIVVACNTASSLSLPALARSFRVPIVGVIGPGVRKALEGRKRGTVGVIGTRATVSSGAYESLLKKVDPSMKVISKACPLFVPIVEEGWLDNAVTADIIKEYLGEFKKRGADSLILGCTHYPLLKPAIKRYMGKGVELIDSALETAKMVKEILRERGLISKKRRSPRHKYFVTDEPSAFKRVGEKFLGGRIGTIKKVRI
ncbi:MAG: glutamate racemase [Candidatus Omnitrophota bacterium]